MPTVEIDLILIALCTVFIFGCGWEAESWHLGSKHAIELQAQIAATNAAEKKADNIAAEFESATQASRVSQDQLLEQWRAADEKPHTVCLLSPDSLRLLSAATTEGTAAR